MQGKRIVYIDWLKAFTIFLVLLGHSVQKFSVDDGLNPLLGMGAFHMSLFMTLSGFFLGKMLDRGLRYILITRSRQLLLPVFSFSVVVFVVAWLFPSLDVREGRDFVAYLTGGDMWFLKYLFIGTVLAYVTDRIFRIRAVAAMLPPALLMALSRVGIFRYYPFLWLGYYVHKHNATIDRHMRWLLPVSFAAFVVLQSFWDFDYDYTYYRFLTIKHGIEFSWPDFVVVTYRFVLGSVASLAFICLFKSIPWDIVERRLPSFSRFCQNAGKRTLGIYCLQIYLLEDVGRCLPHHPDYGVMANAAIVVGVAIAEFVLCSAIVGLMERNRITRLLFLGQR